MKKKLNPFAAFMLKNSHMGMLVNRNDDGDGGDDGNLDQPGGMQGGDNAGSSNAGSGGMGGDVDNDSLDASSGDDKGDDSSGGDDAGDDKGDDKSSGIDYEERFNALDSKVSDLLNALNSSNSGNDGDSGGNKDVDGLDLEHDDLVAMMADDPSEFLSKLTATIEQTVTDKVMRENADNEFNSKIESTIDSYADANPDFEKMWDSGELKSFMDKNPGHNAMSAHLTLTMEQRIADARKEGADEAIKNFRNKANNQVLNGGNGITPDQKDAALKNPAKFGGAAAVIAARAGISN